LLGRLIEETTVPGIQLHYALRKRHIEEVARRFLDERGRQVIVLGGGFDTLAVRLAEEFSAADFLEVDRPVMQKLKTAALEQSAPLHNLSFVPMELPNDDFRDLLARRSAVRPSEQSLFVAEGLLMYLTPDAVEAAFATLRDLSPRGSLFVFTFMEQDACGRVMFRNQAKAVDFWLRLRGESFAWGSSRGEIEGLVARFGFRVREIVSASELRALYLPEAPTLRVPEGECVCIAERV
jgi:methyltransferase (TIGR00027 family)